ncbi:MULTISPECIES: hypothetical protein [unclassified Novosphingobium]|uniref:hypothetical protein n=1 Tax=unclassified Novosphingobium TaxID=2644732 RepID=UPI000ED3CE45|nr:MULTISPECIES: hypothetical protein [unclassified Novosphingobium]HCF25204.1 hypothetical protein [Novosphingobium sp.]HQV02383.1 hypothetical protein [Novosphingobium sp.]
MPEELDKSPPLEMLDPSEEWQRAISFEIQIEAADPRQIRQIAEIERINELQILVREAELRAARKLMSASSLGDLAISMLDYIDHKAFGALLSFASFFSGRQIIKPAPGTLAVLILRFAFSKKAFENVLSQPIADMREEYFEALAKGAIYHARWIKLRGHLALGLTVVAYLFASVVKKVQGIWSAIT